jgi:pyruvate dehydrogenase complex dehydrogenase (E1) component
MAENYCFRSPPFLGKEYAYPAETHEWIEALDAVIERTHGPIERQVDEARQDYSKINPIRPSRRKCGW